MKIHRKKKAAAVSEAAFFITFFLKKTLPALSPLLFCAGALFLGCSGSAPEITEVRQRLTLFEDKKAGRVYEYLSLSVLAKDPDGDDDLESLSLIHDGEELYWQASETNWTRTQIRQQTWLTVGTIIATDDRLPRGRYRLILRDYSGSQAETTFNLSASPPLSRQTFPSLALADDSLELSCSGEEAILMIKSAAEVLLASYILKKGSNPLSVILSNTQIENQAADLYLLEQTTGDSHSFISGPWAAGDYLFQNQK
ncbi:MAG: hypothetical protein LBC67_06220 [Spirochaetales bacterium]|nr:hypothetical protein [Spirochaetales bacterium]